MQSWCCAGAVPCAVVNHKFLALTLQNEGFHLPGTLELRIREGDGPLLSPSALPPSSNGQQCVPRSVGLLAWHARLETVQWMDY